MTWTENLAELSAAVLSPDAFGEPVTVGEVQVLGVFDFPTVKAELQREFQPRARVAEYVQVPRLAVSDADADLFPKGQAFSVRGASFTIASVGQPDGAGMTVFAAAPAQASDPTGATTWR